MAGPSINKTGRRGIFETRRNIIHLLKADGPLDAASLAGTLGITGMAVRQHLTQLEEDELVQFEDVVKGRGRPQRHWSLTEKAASFFPDRHDELMAEMLRAIGSSFGPAGMEQLLQARATQQQENYSRELANSQSLESRLCGLAAIRSREGYMAEIKADEGGEWQLIEHHCPICSAAKACQGFCQKELEVFQSILGNQAEVKRTEHLVAGGRRCIYTITPTGA